MSTPEDTTTPEYTYEDIPLNAQLSDDGEYLRLYLIINGVQIKFGALDIASQRESFAAAAQAGQPADDTTDTKSKK